jgi:hypothetical protein
VKPFAGTTEAFLPANGGVRRGVAVDRAAVVLDALRHGGYADAHDRFSAERVRIGHTLLPRPVTPDREGG